MSKLLLYIQRILSIFLHVSLFILSIYLIWGWLTLSDIKRKAIDNNFDIEQVLSSLVENTGTPINTEITKKNAQGDTTEYRRWSVNQSIKPTYLDRLNITYPHVRLSSDGAYYAEIFIFYPFLRISDNVANFIFCFGVGYLVSLLIVAVRYMNVKRKMTSQYLILRPLVGALSSSCFFLIIISGGNLVWENVSNVKGFSLGLIAVIGALYCDKFETILAKSIKKDLEQEGKREDEL